MAKKNSWGFRKVNWPIIFILYLITLVAGYYAAAGAAAGATIFIWLENMQSVMEDPLRFYWNEYSVPCLIGATACFWLWFLYYLTSAKNYMRGREYGTAHFEEARILNKKLANRRKSYKDKENIVVEKNCDGKKQKDVVNTRNRILSQNIQMSLDTRHTQLNNNILLIGGSGAAKTFRFVKPNLMQMSSSFVVTDPKGELLHSTAGFFKRYEYDVKVLNLLSESEMRKSSRYNPFKYLKNDTDVVKMVTLFMEATKKKGSSSGEQFWEDMAGLLLQGLAFYVNDKGIEIDGKIDHSFKGVMKLVNMLKIEEDVQTGLRKKTEIDNMFAELERESPSHQAVLAYNKAMVGAADTVRSIISTLISRTTFLQTEEILDLLSEDEMDFDTIGVKKTIIYCVIPDDDKTYIPIVSLLYQQMIQRLYYQADFVFRGTLPVHVTLMLDEFANISMSDEFCSWLSTMRGRGMSAIIVIQDKPQIEALYEKKYKSIPGNCDTLIYLGGNEIETHEYICKLLGKETIDKQTQGLTKGKQGHSSINEDVIGRELMYVDEIRKMSTDQCVIIIRGHDPVIDHKIQTPEHPLWEELNNFSNQYTFDGRLERLGNGNIGIKDTEKDGVELASITLVEKTQVDILRAEDERNQQEYESEKRVALLTGGEMPIEPVKRVMDISLEELLKMAEEQNVLDDDMREQMAELTSETSLEDIQDNVEDILYECEEEGPEGFKYFEMVEEVEPEEPSEPEGILEQKENFYEAEKKADEFKELLRHGYDKEQMKILFPLTKKYSPERIHNMFAPDMDVPTMSLMIELLGEI